MKFRRSMAFLLLVVMLFSTVAEPVGAINSIGEEVTSPGVSDPATDPPPDEDGDAEPAPDDGQMNNDDQAAPDGEKPEKVLPVAAWETIEDYELLLRERVGTPDWLREYMAEQQAEYERQLEEYNAQIAELMSSLNSTQASEMDMSQLTEEQKAALGLTGEEAGTEQNVQSDIDKMLSEAEDAQTATFLITMAQEMGYEITTDYLRSVGMDLDRLVADGLDLAALGILNDEEMAEYNAKLAEEAEKAAAEQAEAEAKTLEEMKAWAKAVTTDDMLSFLDAYLYYYGDKSVEFLCGELGFDLDYWSAHGITLEVLNRYQIYTDAQKQTQAEIKDYWENQLAQLYDGTVSDELMERLMAWLPRIDCLEKANAFIGWCQTFQLNYTYEEYEAMGIDMARWVREGLDVKACGIETNAEKAAREAEEAAKAAEEEAARLAEEEAARAAEEAAKAESANTAESVPPTAPADTGDTYLNIIVENKNSDADISDPNVDPCINSVYGGFSELLVPSQSVETPVETTPQPDSAAQTEGTEQVDITENPASAADYEYELPAVDYYGDPILPANSTPEELANAKIGDIVVVNGEKVTGQMGADGIFEIAPHPDFVSAAPVQTESDGTQIGVMATDTWLHFMTATLTRKGTKQTVNLYNDAYIAAGNNAMRTAFRVGDKIDVSAGLFGGETGAVYGPSRVKYVSTNTRAATVDANGVITAKDTGMAYIYAYTGSSLEDTSGLVGWFTVGVVPDSDEYIAFPQLSTNTTNTMILKANGTLWAWGSNYSGLLGIGNTDGKLYKSPNQVMRMNDEGKLVPLTGVLRVVVCPYSALALTEDGKIWGWGNNQYGGFGNGTTNGTVGYAKRLTGSYFDTKKFTWVFSMEASGSAAADLDGNFYQWGRGSTYYNSAWMYGYTYGNNTPVCMSDTYPAMKNLLNMTVDVCRVSGAVRADGRCVTWGNGDMAAREGSTSSSYNYYPDVSNPIYSVVKHPTQISQGRAFMGVKDLNGEVYYYATAGYGLSTIGYSGWTNTPRKVTQVSKSSTGEYPMFFAGYCDWYLMTSEGHVYTVTSNGSPASGKGTTNGGLAKVLVGAQKNEEAYKNETYLSDVVVLGKQNIGGENNVQYAMAATRNGSVYGWGYNNNGQLGDGTTTTRTTPVQVYSGMESYLDATVGWYYKDYDVTGHVGTGEKVTMVNDAYVKASDNTVMTAINVGDAIQIRKQDIIGVQGTFTVWRDYGTYEVEGEVVLTSLNDGVVRIENGNVIVAENPGIAVILVNDEEGIKAFYKVQVVADEPGRFAYPQVVVSGTQAGQAGTNNSAGAYALALKGDGTVWAWGDNPYGNLGNGMSGDHAISPVQVIKEDGTPLTNIAKVAAGNYTSVALDRSGAVWTWGYNAGGSLGDGKTQNRAYAKKVEGELKNVIITDITAGQFVLASSREGKVYGWGYNVYQIISTASAANAAITSPVNMSQTQAALANIIEVEAGTQHAFALRADGAIISFGSGGSGALAQQGNTGNSLYVAATADLFSLTAATRGIKIVMTGAGWANGISLNTDGDVYGWGYSPYYSLGNAATNTALVKIAGLSSTPNTAAYPLQAVTKSYTAVLRSDGQISTLGSAGLAVLGQGSTAANGVIGLVKAGEQAQQSGYQGNTYFQDAIAISKDNYYYTTTAANYNAYSSMFAITGDGWVYGWGRNDFGQLGIASNTLQVTNTPMKVGANSYLDIQALRLSRSGGSFQRVEYYNDSYVLNNKTRSTFYVGDRIRVNGADIAADNGFNVFYDTSYTPTGLTMTSLNSDVARVETSGSVQTLRIVGVGTAYIVVQDDHGVRGFFTVKAVQENSAFIAYPDVAGGADFAIALKANGTVWAWGNNDKGQLGDGSNVTSSTPVQVMRWNNAMTGLVELTGIANVKLKMRKI